MTDATIDQARLDRIEALRRRRIDSASSAPNGAEEPEAEPAPHKPQKRGHAALGSRIAATGLGATAMLGIVTAMGVNNQAAAPPERATNATPPSVVVVVHRTSPDAPAVIATSEARVDQPIVLDANPVVRTVQAATSPSSQTNGSR